MNTLDNEINEKKINETKEEVKVKYINLPLQFSSIRSEIIKKITEICESGDFILGNELNNFEKSFEEYCECKHAIGVANGTDALMLSMVALGIWRGDEVITVPNSFLATAGAIVAIGAKPVFVDVGEDYNINPKLIENAITPKTKAIIPVHLTGRSADMNPIQAIAEKHHLYIIEDAAQAIGAKYFGKIVGNFGITGCFSLHPLKNLNAYGDGGVITTNNDEIYEKLIKLRNHGLKNRVECELWGYNSRLDCIQAAIVNIKIKYLDEWNLKIRRIAKIYIENLSGVVKVPFDKPHEMAVYHTFIIQTNKRDELQNYLLSKGVETKIHYPIPIHLQAPARLYGYKEGDFPIAELQAKTILSLPIYPELTEEQVMYVISQIKSFFR